MFRYARLNEIQSYTDYKDSFRKYSETNIDIDPFRANIFKARKGSQEDQSAYLARLDTCRQEITTMIKNYDCLKDDASSQIDQVIYMIAMGKIWKTRTK